MHEEVLSNMIIETCKLKYQMDLACKKPVAQVHTPVMKLEAVNAMIKHA